jgi:hypothetical protein
MTHAYDQPEVLIGAGTLALDIEQQGGLPDSVLVRVGGRGLIGGVASWFEQRSRVVALEPELAPTLFKARESGGPVDVCVSGFAADSLGAKRIGSLAWRLPKPMSGTPCCCPMTLSAQRSCGCGKNSNPPPSPLQPCRWQHCRPDVMFPSQTRKFA